MTMKIRPPATSDITAFLRRLFLRTEKELIQEIKKKRNRKQVEYAEVAALLSADDYDLWQIVKIGSTCPVCAPLEGRIYSKSGIR